MTSILLAGEEMDTDIRISLPKSEKIVSNEVEIKPIDECVCGCVCGGGRTGTTTVGSLLSPSQGFQGLNKNPCRQTCATSAFTCEVISLALNLCL